MLNMYLLITLSKLFSFASISTVITSTYIQLIISQNYLFNFAHILRVLKFSSLFRLNTLVELTATDSPFLKHRFTLNTFLLSVEYNFRLALNINLSLTDFVPSLSTTYVNSS
jgi:hypothetical protein